MSDLLTAPGELLPTPLPALEGALVIWIVTAVAFMLGKAPGFDTPQSLTTVTAVEIPQLILVHLLHVGVEISFGRETSQTVAAGPLSLPMCLFMPGQGGGRCELLVTGSALIPVTSLSLCQVPLVMYHHPVPFSVGEGIPCAVIVPLLISSVPWGIPCFLC